MVLEGVSWVHNDKIRNYVVLKGVNWVQMQKSGHMVLRGVIWLQNDKTGSNDLERSQLGTQ